jgi:hypothetical protein
VRILSQERPVPGADKNLERRLSSRVRIDPCSSSTGPQAIEDDKKQIRKLGKELRRKEKALAETAALLVLRKKLNAFYEEGQEDD